ncbi:tryptophan 2,3-dioxygenase [Planotetraspora phitsanulokensis]|uniref:Tryptophan 2,3-dioxygenase n=1 Tax=Planotetraspora phitsanulokensis TaxID=575192 RepID=A0A8J3UBU1_9ACTN|nr:tryptophan 2,3-dioxygenase family protein [Planotetraspora phitsanulokensis]GII41897.1 tryptophan 2,3-dioxygenase [Planotetraspora phitsanulokensis]
MVTQSWRDLRPETAVSGEMSGTTRYIDYFQVRQLHTLQRPVTETAYEMAFLISSQVMELYFGLLCHELSRARREVLADDVPAALRTLRRIVAHLRALEATWESYADMTPSDWNPIKAQLGKGEASSVHSYMYRHLAFLLGQKSPEMLEPHRSTPLIHQGLQDALSAPSLYDEVLALLQRRGLPLPDSTIHRDFAEPYVAQPEVEAAWAQVYHDESFTDLRELGEALTQVADRFNRWKQVHLTVTMRTFGAKPGYYHTPAVGWLHNSLDQTVFPELWSARTAM